MDQEEFRDIRENELKWTLKKLADEMGVNWNTIWRWENGRNMIPDMAANFLLLLRKHPPSKKKWQKKGP